MLVNMCKKGKSCALLVGRLIDIATVENSMEVPQETKMEPAYDPAISLQCVWEKMKTLIWKDT